MPQRLNIRFTALLVTLSACLAALGSVEAQILEVIDHDPAFVVRPAGEDFEFDFVSELASVETADISGHGKSCKCCGPQWTFAGGALYMERTRPDSAVLAFDTGDPTRNLNAEALTFGFDAGWEVSARRDSGDRGLEVRFMNLDGWDAATTAIAGVPSLIRVTTVVPFDLPGVTAVNATYNSELLGFELNLHSRASDRVRVLGGFRYLELDEHFHFDTNAAVFPSTYDTLTANRLYGGQTGVEATILCRDRWTLEGNAKLGVFYNDSSQFSRFDTGLVLVTAADTSERVAFVGELGVTSSYCLTDCLSLRASYNLIWIDSVVLASDQVQSTNFGTGSGIDPNGNAFYHGGIIGLEYRR